MLSLTLRMAQLESGVQKNMTMSQYAQNHGPDTEAAKLNSLIFLFTPVLLLL